MSIERIEKYIFQTLCCESGTWLDASNIYTKYLAENGYTEKSEFMKLCLFLGNKYRNVYTTTNYGNLFLIFTSKQPNLVTFRSTQHVTVPSNDYCDLIKYMLEMGVLTKEMVMKYYDGIDTILHSLYRNSNYEFANNLIKQFGIDSNIKNANGETLIDVVNLDPKTKELFRSIMKSFYDNQLGQINKSVNATIKEKNNEILYLKVKLYAIVLLLFFVIFKTMF
jgi:hypothetical protein